MIHTHKERDTQIKKSIENRLGRRMKANTIGITPLYNDKNRL